MDCKLENSFHEKIRERKKEQRKDQAKKSSTRKNLYGCKQKQKVGYYHSQNLVGSFTIIQISFWKMTACVELVERRTGEHQGERVG